MNEVRKIIQEKISSRSTSSHTTSTRSRSKSWQFKKEGIQIDAAFLPEVSIRYRALGLNEIEQFSCWLQHRRK